MWVCLMWVGASAGGTRWLSSALVNNGQPEPGDTSVTSP